MKKYELLTDDTIEVCGRTLFRIRALVSFGSVEAGHVGGYIESENNLSQVSGDAWVSGYAQVSDTAQVSGNAQVSDTAQVYGNALVSGNAQVSGDRKSVV